MNKEQEKAMTEYWRKRSYPTYVHGFEDGIKYQSGVVSPDEYLCPYCERKSYPDYGVCAFCGVRK